MEGKPHRRALACAGDCDEKPVSVPDLLALVSDTLQRHEAAQAT